jgi:hypothetical protein
MPVNQTPLMPRNCPTLYDEACMLDLNVHMAQGFAILLTGAGCDLQALSQARKNGPSKQSTRLGFSALTDGNVVDACFGNTTRSFKSQPASPQGQRQIKEVKRVLGDADDDDKIPRIAVGAYAKGFKSILKFRSDVDKLNFITRCFRYGTLKRRAKAALEEAFAPLQDALDAAQ